MPRIRTIKPGFFRSDDVSMLSLRARLTWIGLWTYVDDDGRGVDNPRLIKGDLWALDDDVTWTEVEADLVELETAGRIVRYTATGKRYLAVTNWAAHQVISKSTPSRLPAPPDTEPAPVMSTPVALPEDSGSPPGEVTAGRGRGSRKWNREEEGEEEEDSARARGAIAPAPIPLLPPPEPGPVISTPAPAPPRPDPDGFDEFWTAYPRRVDRPAAKRAWAKAIRGTPAAVIVAAARRHAADPNRADQFTKHPGPWLNAEAWNDPPLPARHEPPGNPARESSLARRDRQVAQMFADLAAPDPPPARKAIHA